MSRKDYEAVAKILWAARVKTGGGIPSGNEIAIDLVAASLADHFAADNPRFDREKFLFACGVAL